MIIDRVDTWTPRRKARTKGKVTYSRRHIRLEAAELDSNGQLHFDTVQLHHEDAHETFTCHTETYQDDRGRLHAMLVVSCYGGKVLVQSR